LILSYVSDKQTDKQTDRQTDRQTDKQTNRESQTYYPRRWTEYICVHIVYDDDDDDDDGDENMFEQLSQKCQKYRMLHQNKGKRK